MVDTSCPVIEITTKAGTVTSTGTTTPTDENPIAGILSLAFFIQLIGFIITLIILYIILKWMKVI